MQSHITRREALALAGLMTMSGCTGRNSGSGRYANQGEGKWMSPDAFREQLLKHKRSTREMIVTAGDSGQKPITKISGIPWWPAKLERPKCQYGHFMSFMAQYLLSDVPSLESTRNSLASFHYCERCTYEGKMSFGWNCSLGNKSGYKVTIFHDIASLKPDGRGTVAEVVIAPQIVRFRDVVEVPGYYDTTHSIGLEAVPDDYPQGVDDFDENIYPGQKHVKKSKVGGWPSWVQSPNPPATTAREKLYFIGQLDWWLCDKAAWLSGGYAYIFLIANEETGMRGELALQTT